jgi:Zn ribbon nucleic-acid-binding protein
MSKNNDLNVYECLSCGWTFMGNVDVDGCIICGSLQKENNKTEESNNENTRNIKL